MIYQSVVQSPSAKLRVHTDYTITIPCIITIVSMYAVYVGPYLLPPSEIRPVCTYVITVLAIINIHIVLLTFLITSKILFTCKSTWYRIIVYLSLLFLFFCICTLMVVCQVPEWEFVEYGWEIGVLILLLAGISTARNRWLLVLIVLVGQFQWFPNVRGTPAVRIWIQICITIAQLPLVIVVFVWGNKSPRTIPCLIMAVAMLAIIYVDDRLLLATTDSYTMYAILALRGVSVLVYTKQLISQTADIESMFFVLVIVFVPLVLSKLPNLCIDRCKCKRLCCLTG
jgi:hypothetical protein